MQNAEVSNPNDYKVVTFHNSTDFGFTAEMGCMYDGRAINGPSGAPGIQSGESMALPYHIGHRLAVNLAKRVLNTSPAATVDATGIPTGVAVWSPDKLKEIADKYITELYTESKPIAQSETDRLMAKLTELQKFVEDNVTVKTEAKGVEGEKPVAAQSTKTYQDKQEVIAELEVRGIKFDRRASKANLEKLLI